MRTITTLLLVTGLMSLSLSCTSKEQKSYILYFEQINEAEAHIYRGELPEALAVYTNVFKQYDHADYKDLHNACLSAVKLGKYKEAFAFLPRLVAVGYELTDFDSDGFEVLQTEAGWEDFQSTYPKLRETYLGGLDMDAREQFIKLKEEDQKYAKMRAQTAEDRKIVFSKFYELSQALSALINEKGFPPYRVHKDTFDINVMLRHYCGLKNLQTYNPEFQKDSFYRAMNIDTDEIAWQALNDGMITPADYESITTYQTINPYGSLFITVDYDTETVTTDVDKGYQLDSMNVYRKRIGLPLVDQGDFDVLLQSTHYTENYPFKEVKEFLSTDTTKPMMPREIYADFIAQEMHEKNTDDKLSGFILRSTISYGIMVGGDSVASEELWMGDKIEVPDQLLPQK